MKHSYKSILPEYPSLRHLPWKPNNKGDNIASEEEASIIFNSSILIQEKIDGANCGMTFLDGHPVVRSRTKILRKGQDLKNPSLKQFASAWNWMHENQQKFEQLAEIGPYSVYGEWMIQQHGMVYDRLSDWFIAYDLYDYEKQHFLAAHISDQILKSLMFETIPALILLDSKIVSYEFLEELANKTSFFSEQLREGIIVKTFDEQWTTGRFKMVRQGFDQGCLLGDTIKKNILKCN